MSGRKRAATNSSAEASSSKHTAKKIRFVDPLDDPEEFAAEIESALETPSAHRKGRVKNEGYESDSSDDGESVVQNRKKNASGADDAEEVDMFALVDKEEKGEQEESGKKKKEKYMRLGDIDGQEFRSDQESEESEGEPEDEDDAERRKKAGMGYELSSFNMREEMEEGKFTEDGSYIRTFDPHQVHDRWMDGVSEKDMKQARKHKRQQEKIQKEKMEAEDKKLEESGGKVVLEKDLLPFLKKGETVLEALQRLGVQAKKHRNQAKPSTAATDIDKVTHLASTIMSLGDTDIYSKTYEELARSVRSTAIVDPAWEPPSADVRYEYKWALPNSGQHGDTFGPFSEEDMKSWMQASYFGPAGETIKVRQVGGEWGDWEDVME